MGWLIPSAGDACVQAVKQVENVEDIQAKVEASAGYLLGLGYSLA